MSKKIPKQYLLSEEEKLEYIKNLSKADIWDFNYTDTSKIEWETKALLAEGRKSIEKTKTIIAKMTDNGMDTSEAESKLKFYQECIDGFQEVEESNRKILKDRNTKLMQIISNSDYKIDDDGVPSNIKPNRKELTEMFCEPKMLEKYKKGYENKVFPEGITLDGLVEYEWKMQKVPLAVDMIMSKLGEDWKKQVTNLQKKLDNAKLKVASAKKGKKYPNEQTYLICDELEKYWANNLPTRYLTRKKYFQKIADEFGMSFKSIERIEKEYRPKRFTPSRTK
tara:strand:+ start:759 stop:1598 length:840 start_codon:yes stop_codon:yes gene_type:complete